MTDFQQISQQSSLIYILKRTKARHDEHQVGIVGDFHH